MPESVPGTVYDESYYRPDNGYGQQPDNMNVWVYSYGEHSGIISYNYIEEAGVTYWTDNVYGETKIMDEPDQIASIIAIIGIVFCVAMLLLCLILLVMALFCQRTAEDWQNAILIGWILRLILTLVVGNRRGEGGYREDRYK